MNTTHAAMQVLRARFVWRAMTGPERRACLQVTSLCVERALSGADPFLAPVRTTQRMHRYMLDACGLAPGISITGGGAELFGYQVIDLSLASSVARMNGTA